MRAVVWRSSGNGQRRAGFVIRFLQSGDTSLVIEFSTEMDRKIARQVLELFRRVERAGIAGIVETVPTFRSLMVHYDPTKATRRSLVPQLEALLEGLEVAEGSGRVWHLPACYEGELAPDLDDVAQRTSLTPDEVVAQHSAETYLVYMVGFLPGFPYMGDLPQHLQLPRREEPRLRVPMGSVAIATAMTGVYTFESPGGWHLIGRTPVRIFDLRRQPAALFEPGDEVCFVPISRAEFDAQERAAAAGTLTLRPLEAAP